ncbi:hypothetical protein [Methylomonas rapida]|jgi:hypothetical protein|uniref:Uncharacterized protein n=1 Tax=Methylomonas rapida TaxID=2963939 RepID=A0ABY7GKN1_9GAMM|nr:hypothetical protein [Methylomonas rapida]WAR45060.1 hypothetical protein NM686_000705 [Methylomonas rapida]
MVAYPRLFLVLLLVVLQVAAPLVHAHVDDIGAKRGLHLHEFEALHLKADALFSAADDYFAAVQSAIVEVGAAIKIQQTEQSDAPVYCLNGDLPALPEQPVLDAINFSPHRLERITEPFLDQYPSRAPPA